MEKSATVLFVDAERGRVLEKAWKVSLMSLGLSQREFNYFVFESLRNTCAPISIAIAGV